MDRNEYKAGLVGVGRVGRIHADVYRSTEGIELTALGDADQELLATRGDDWDIPPVDRYRDIRELLEGHELDVLSVASPSSLQFEHVTIAAQSETDLGVIYCERPLAGSVRQPVDMVSACDRADTELLVDHTLRFSETFTETKRLIQDGLVGSVESVQAHAGGASFGWEGTHIMDLLERTASNRSPGLEAAHVVEVLTGIFLSEYRGGTVEIPVPEPLRTVSITTT